MYSAKTGWNRDCLAAFRRLPLGVAAAKLGVELVREPEARRLGLPAVSPRARQARRAGTARFHRRLPQQAGLADFARAADGVPGAAVCQRWLPD